MTVKAKADALLIPKKLLLSSELLIILSFLVMLKLSDTAKAGALSGLVLTAGTILPSIFPFMVLGDFLSCHISNNGLGLFEGAVCRIFGVTRYGAGIAISGLLCGFPSSAKAAAQAYRAEAVEKEKAVVLAALTSNPSPPFIIGVVGSLFGGTLTGGVLFLSLALSVISASLIFGRKRQENPNFDITARQKYRFIDSVKGAGAASITVFSFVTLFCTLIEIIKRFVGGGVFFSFTVAILEVSTALFHLISKSNLPQAPLYALVGFSIGFGGLCANLQCASFLTEVGLKVGKFFFIKLVLGGLCALFTPILLSLI